MVHVFADGDDMPPGAMNEEGNDCGVMSSSASKRSKTGCKMQRALLV
jgi:hypothetical protein